MSARRVPKAPERPQQTARKRGMTNAQILKTMEEEDKLQKALAEKNKGLSKKKEENEDERIKRLMREGNERARKELVEFNERLQREVEEDKEKRLLSLAAVAPPSGINSMEHLLHALPEGGKPRNIDLSLESSESPTPGHSKIDCGEDIDEDEPEWEEVSDHGSYEGIGIIEEEFIGEGASPLDGGTEAEDVENLPVVITLSSDSEDDDAQGNTATISPQGSVSSPGTSKKSEDDAVDVKDDSTVTASSPTPVSSPGTPKKSEDDAANDAQGNTLSASPPGSVSKKPEDDAVDAAKDSTVTISPPASVSSPGTPKQSEDDAVDDAQCNTVTTPPPVLSPGTPEQSEDAPVDDAQGNTVTTSPPVLSPETPKKVLPCTERRVTRKVGRPKRMVEESPQSEKQSKGSRKLAGKPKLKIAKRLKKGIGKIVEKESNASAAANDVAAAAALLAKAKASRRGPGRPKKLRGIFPPKRPFDLSMFNGPVRKKETEKNTGQNTDAQGHSWIKSTIEDLIEYGIGYKLRCLPKSPEKKEELADLAIGHLKGEVRPQPPAQWQTKPSGPQKPKNLKSRKDLTDLDSWHITGARYTEDGKEYQVEWRDGYGGSDDEEDGDGDDYLYFEECDFDEWFRDKMPAGFVENNGANGHAAAEAEQPEAEAEQAGNGVDANGGEEATD